MKMWRETAEALEVVLPLCKNKFSIIEVWDNPNLRTGMLWEQTTELYNNWRTCSYTSFSQPSEAKNMADFE
jgi:hypothetical protein